MAQLGSARARLQSSSRIPEECYQAVFAFPIAPKNAPFAHTTWKPPVPETAQDANAAASRGSFSLSGPHFPAAGAAPQCQIPKRPIFGASSRYVWGGDVPRPAWTHSDCAPTLALAPMRRGFHLLPLGPKYTGATCHT